MNILADCSFSDFNSSDFMDFFTNGELGKYILETPTAKLVLCSEYCGYGEFLHSIYEKGDSPNSRWHKRFDLSGDQLRECNVFLVGDEDNNPVEIIMEVGASLVSFLLTDDMKESFKEARECGLSNFFPGWE